MGRRGKCVPPNGPHVANHRVVDHGVFLNLGNGWEEIRESK